MNLTSGYELRAVANAVNINADILEKALAKIDKLDEEIKTLREIERMKEKKKKEGV